MKKRIVFIISVVAILASCKGGEERRPLKTVGDSLAYIAAMQRQLDNSLSVIDSLEQAGALSTHRADYWRGVTYDYCWHAQLASHYYKKALDAYTEPIHEVSEYAETGCRLAWMHAAMQDHKGAMSLAMQTIDTAERNGELTNWMHAHLMELIINSQFKLGQYDEVRKNATKAYMLLEADKQTTESDKMIFSRSLLSYYYNMGDLDKAEEWLAKMEQLHSSYDTQAKDSIERALSAEYQGHISLYKAKILQAKGKVKEAADVYKTIPKSQLYQPNSISEATEYLMDAGRYDDALALFAVLDTMSTVKDAQNTFERIQDKMIPRYMANLKAGHTAQALTLATDICESVDSALATQRKNNIAELSVIYETQQKEMALQHAHFQSMLYLLIIIGLALIVVLAGWLLMRSYQYNKLQTEKNRQLYAQIQQCEREHQRADMQLKSRPQEQLTAGQKLYVRLCQLMEEEKPFTNADLKREELAAMLGTNHSYLGDAIRECTGGQTVGAFVDSIRTEYAARLLATKDDPIGLIAEMAGFNNRVHFNKLFRDRYQLTPSEYRKAAKEDTESSQNSQKEAPIWCPRRSLCHEECPLSPLGCSIKP